MAANPSKDRRSNRLAQAGLAYGAAILLAGMVASVRWLIDPWIGGFAQYTLFYLMVAVVAVMWGWRVGLFAALLGAGAGWWLFIHLGHTHDRSSAPVVHLGLYLAIAGLIVALVEWGRRQRQSSRHHAVELEAERARWQGVVEGIADEVWVCDAQGRMSLINLPDTTAMGLREFANKSVYQVLEEVEILLPDGRPRLPEDAPLLRALHGEIVRGEEIMRHRASGRTRWREFSAAPTRDATGQITGAVAIARDITEHKQAEKALAAARMSAERAKHAAEEASHAKDHFLAVLSHELRTPLTPVVAAVSMLQEQMQNDAVQRETLEMIRRNVEMEARLIDDLLDVTRIVRGKVELARQPTYLCEVLRRAAEVCRPDIEARQIHFGIDIGKDAPYRIEADPARLQQVFWNLLKNAVKFTPHAGRIGIRCHREDKQVVIEVTDSGEGIDPALLPHIFNAFEQGGTRVTRQFGGLGLGLTITKGVVEMHGGTIDAHSEGKGKGATFRIRLPLCSGPEPLSACPPDKIGEVALGRMGRGPAPGRKLRILLVEDHGDTAKVMQRLLMRHGHQVETAGDMTTALEMAESEPFDLLLSDLGLPDGSGVDLMRTLREHGRMLPGIALSGYGQEEDIRRSREAGFSAHLTKPVNPDRLSTTIVAVTGKPSVAQKGGNGIAPPGMKAP